MMMMVDDDDDEGGVAGDVCTLLIGQDSNKEDPAPLKKT